MFVRNLSSKARWEQKSFDKIGRKDGFLSGDAVSDLRTIDNKISVWEVNDDDTESLIAILTALALGRDKISKIEYVTFSKEDLDGLDIETEEELGKTQCMRDERILKMHKNLVKIDYWRIGYLTDFIAKLIADNKGKSLDKNELKKSISNLYNAGVLDLTKASDKMKENIFKELKIDVRNSAT